MTKFNKYAILALLVIGVCPLTISSAEAGPKFGGLWWWHNHWVNQDFKPYYENGTEPHMKQWDSSEWQPSDWIEMNHNDAENLIYRWYTAKIIDAQYFDDGVPYLDIGINFYHLSGYDKGRVMATIDHVYQITSQTPRMFYLKDPETNRIIGYYGADGLILQ